jgi:hypothetical protein
MDKVRNPSISLWPSCPVWCCTVPGFTVWADIDGCCDMSGRSVATLSTEVACAAALSAVSCSPQRWSWACLIRLGMYFSRVVLATTFAFSRLNLEAFWKFTNCHDYFLKVEGPVYPWSNFSRLFSRSLRPRLIDTWNVRIRWDLTEFSRHVFPHPSRRRWGSDRFHADVNDYGTPFSTRLYTLRFAVFICSKVISDSNVTLFLDIVTERLATYRAEYKDVVLRQKVFLTSVLICEPLPS